MRERNNVFCLNLQTYIPEKATWTNQELMKAQSKDIICKIIPKHFNNNNDKINEDKTKIKTEILLNTRIIKGVIYIQRNVKRRGLVDQYLVPYIPDSPMPKALQLVHSDVLTGHNGPDKSLKMFSKNFYNFNERNLIESFCKACELCIQAKQTPKPVPIQEYPVPVQPFHPIASDILGSLSEAPNGCKYILTDRDYTTRYTILFQLRNKSTEQIIESLRLVFANFGPSHILITDNAPKYVAGNLKLSLKKLQL